MLTSPVKALRKVCFPVMSGNGFFLRFTQVERLCTPHSEYLHPDCVASPQTSLYLFNLLAVLFVLLALLHVNEAFVSLLRLYSWEIQED